MLDVIKPLVDSNLITEETRQEITEAWESKLSEAREQVRTELREEFAQRYEHDKKVMIEALDKMVSEGLQSEIQALHNEKRALVEDRVRLQKKLSENVAKFNKFLTIKLAEELSELRKDRNMHRDGLAKMESFVAQNLAREITEFATDRQDVINTKVRLVREARQKLESLKARFIKENSTKISRVVTQHLKSELGQLHEDIRVARENSFGRRIFEAFAAEFGATHLNENAEMRKLHDVINAKNRKLSEAVKLAQRARVLIEGKERELRMIKESAERRATLDELLKPLNKEKAEIMRNLLESVQTPRLKNAFDKYLPAVLAERRGKASKVITESVVEVTGDKSTRTPVNEVSDEKDNVIDIKRLAGL